MSLFGLSCSGVELFIGCPLVVVVVPFRRVTGRQVLVRVAPSAFKVSSIALEAVTRVTGEGNRVRPFESHYLAATVRGLGG